MSLDIGAPNGASAGGNAACWRLGFSYEACCSGAEGDPECFDEVYTYERCCLRPSENIIPECTPEEITRSPRNLWCRGNKYVSSSAWEAFFHAHLLSTGFGPTFRGWPNATELLDAANQSRESWRVTQEDCVQGLAAVILHSLPNIELRTNSLEAARRAYAEASRLLGTVVTDLEDDCRWNKMINHWMFAHYDMLLGQSNRFYRRCPEGAARVYVYETGDWAGNPVECARKDGFWGSEVYIDRFLRQSPCRESDWRKADVFFVPLHLVCWELRTGKSLPEAEWQMQQNSFAQEVASLPYYQMHGGYNHVMAFGASTWLSGWKTHLPNTVFLAVESVPLECHVDPQLGQQVCSHCRNCYNAWKDVVVPPVVSFAMSTLLLARCQPFAKRSLVMTWHGQHANATDAAVASAYRAANETVRLDILNLRSMPKVSIGGPTSNYALVMGHAHFCLCPQGSSSYTARVFEALLAGCIPVILSDDLKFPFDSFVDWSKISIRWPMRRVGVEMYDYLSNLIAQDPAKVMRMQEAVQEARCWFDYFGILENPMTCSPYLAILLSLRRRMEARPRQQHGFEVSNFA